MKHCVKYPDDKFLAVRPCLVAICLDNRPAAKLLGALLFRYNLRTENKDDAENQNAVKSAKGEQPDQDTSYRIFRKQSQLVDDMCGELTEKTLHDVAVPMLQLLGYLELEEYMQANCYTINVERVQEALNLYAPTERKQSQLENFLISTMPLENFLISTDELEKSLIDKKYFLLQLEKVLIQNRKISNYKRGRKGTPEDGSHRKNKRLKNLKEITKKNIEENVNADALTRTQTENNNQYQLSTNETTSPQDIHTEQPSTAIPIATTKGDTTHGRDTDTLSLPVLNPDYQDTQHHATPQGQAALIGVATRNTDSLPEIPQTAAPNKQRGSRKPKVTKPEDESMEKRIDAVLNCLDELGTEYAGEEFHYSRFKTDKEAVKTLLTSWQNLSREQVQATYRFMMDTPKSDDGWLWSDHMSVKAFCNNFATQYARMRKKGTSNGHAPPMSALDQAISKTRNLDKEGAEMEARYSRKRAQ